jgi:hypothetical protein
MGHWDAGGHVVAALRRAGDVALTDRRPTRAA